MLTKESKITVLENFYGLDYIFFGKPIKEIETCCLVLAEDYMSIKGAVMSVMIEMYKLVEHMPDSIKKKMNTSDILKEAKIRAIHAREMSQKLVSSEKGRSDVKAELREAIANDASVNVNETVESTIRTKAFKLACDNLLIASAITESINYQEMNEWAGRIIEDSYKILRDSLVDSALLILNEV